MVDLTEFRQRTGRRYRLRVDDLLEHHLPDEQATKLRAALEDLSISDRAIAKVVTDDWGTLLSAVAVNTWRNRNIRD